MAARSRAILLVEDDPDSRTALSMLLELDGFTVVSYDGREAAMQYLGDGARPDVIITDLQLPDDPSGTLQQDLGADPALRAIPVVVLSGRDRPAALTPNVVAYVRKGGNPEVLLNVVRAGCGRGY
jgi:CheY-like chemotaxis protein